MDHIIFTSEVGKVLMGRLQGVSPDDIFVLADCTTSRECLSLFEANRFKKEQIIVIKEGEQHKSLQSVEFIWSVLMANGARRNSVLINIGGGLITDVGGFAASCFKRGIRCINVPTTLLAQVDASVGGKTGINFGGLKNEIGTFSIPECVIIDNGFLKTLPHRQVLSGFAEMLKHALLSGKEQVNRMLNLDLIRVDAPDFLQLIKESVEVKDRIVEADPRETGVRKALNFGHTVGHAIESVAIDYQVDLYHGDAVAYGMIVELYLSVKRYAFDVSLYKNIKNFICSTYPVYSPLVEPEKLYELMLHDKKNDRKGVNFTLLRNPGEFITDNYCSRYEILEALKELTN